MMRSVNRFDVPELLRNHAADCAQLADNMLESGRSLNGHERELVKSAFSPMINEVLGEIKFCILQDIAPTEQIETITRISEAIKIM